LTTKPPKRNRSWVLAGRRLCVVGFACGKINDEPSELIGVARALA